MNNNEVPIYADNNEQILIRTVKGNSLLLKYSILPIEKILVFYRLLDFRLERLFAAPAEKQ